MTDPVNNEKRMGNFEFTVRHIPELLPDMPTSRLRDWKAILQTALAHVDKELTSTCLHTCRICFMEEWGYRDELPSFWYYKGDAEICFNHEYKDAEKLLKDAGYEVDAFFPPDVPNVSVDALELQMKNLPPAPSQTDQAYQDLLDEL